jgi:hypothetical protein
MNRKHQGGFGSLISAAVAAGALALLACPTPAAAAAQTIGSYYQDAGALTCNATQCLVYFSNLPAGKGLVAQKVSCRIETAGAPSFTEMELTSKQSPSSNRFTALWTGTSGNFRYYLANADVLYLATTQPFVRLKTKTGSIGQIYCSIAGQIS